jgi:hypothetical protein
MASYSDLEKQLNNLTPKEVTETLQRQFDIELKKIIKRNIIISRGSVTGLNESAGKIIKDAVSTFIKSPQYKDSLKELLRNIEGVSKTKQSIYKDADFVIPKTDLTNAQKLATDEFIDAMNEDGLNARFNQILRTSIYDSIRLGLSQNDLISSVSTALKTKKGEPIMANHVTNLTQMASDSYSKSIDQAIFNKYEDRITHFRVVGTLIDTSSPQCVRAVKDYNREIPIDEVDDWIAFAKENGGNEDLSPKNLSKLGGHPRCRHSFSPIIKL